MSCDNFFYFDVLGINNEIKFSGIEQNWLRKPGGKKDAERNYEKISG